MIFPLHITCGDLRKAMADSPDEAPLCITYGEVCSDYVFARVDGLHTKVPGKICCSDPETDREWEENYPHPSPVLTISLTSGEDNDEDEEDEDDELDDEG